ASHPQARRRYRPHARLFGHGPPRESCGVAITREEVMKQWIAVLFVAVIGLAGAARAEAQETRSTEGPVVVTIIPGGGTFFTKGKDTGAPSFGNYGLGGAVEVNLNRFVGVEGEVAGALGVT